MCKSQGGNSKAKTKHSINWLINRQHQNQQTHYKIREGILGHYKIRGKDYLNKQNIYKG